ncbi:unnamed protein product [Discula destructiva]
MQLLRKLTSRKRSSPRKRRSNLSLRLPDVLSRRNTLNHESMQSQATEHEMDSSDTKLSIDDVVDGESKQEMPSSPIQREIDAAGASQQEIASPTTESSVDTDAVTNVDLVPEVLPSPAKRNVRALVPSVSDPDLSTNKRDMAAKRQATEKKLKMKKAKAKQKKQQKAAAAALSAATQERARLEGEFFQVLDEIVASNEAMLESEKLRAEAINDNNRLVLETKIGLDRMGTELNHLTSQMQSMTTSFGSAYAQLEKARAMTCTAVGTTVTAPQKEALAWLKDTTALAKTYVEEGKKNAGISKWTVIEVDGVLRNLDILYHYNKEFCKSDSVTNTILSTGYNFKDASCDPRYKYLTTGSPKHENVPGEKAGQHAIGTTSINHVKFCSAAYTDAELSRGSFVPLGPNYALFTHPDTLSVTMFPRDAHVDGLMQKPNAPGLPLGPRQPNRGSSLDDASEALFINLSQIITSSSPEDIPKAISEALSEAVAAACAPRASKDAPSTDGSVHGVLPKTSLSYREFRIAVRRAFHPQVTVPKGKEEFRKAFLKALLTIDETRLNFEPDGKNVAEGLEDIVKTTIKLIRESTQFGAEGYSEAALAASDLLLSLIYNEEELSIIKA